MKVKRAGPLQPFEWQVLFICNLGGNTDIIRPIVYTMGLFYLLGGLK